MMMSCDILVRVFVSHSFVKSGTDESFNLILHNPIQNWSCNCIDMFLFWHSQLHPSFLNQKIVEKRVYIVKWISFVIEESAQEFAEKGVEAAESGDFGKALSLLSHAVVLDDKDYKSMEMIAQVTFYILLWIDPPNARKAVWSSEIRHEKSWCQTWMVWRTCNISTSSTRNGRSQFITRILQEGNRIAGWGNKS